MATFTRNSTAYLQDGTLVNTNLPRYEQGRFAQAVMVEEGVANLLPEAISQGRSGALSNNFAISTLTFVTNFGRSSLFSMLSEQVAVGNNAGFYTLGGNHAPVTAGLVYTLTCWVFTNHSSRSARAHANFLDSGNGVLLDVGGLATPLTPGAWTRVSVTATAPANAINLRVTATGLGTWQVGDRVWYTDLQVEQRPYATTWQIGGTPRAEEIISAPLANVVLPAQGTIEFWWNPQIPFSAITNQGTSPMLLQIGDYHSNASLTLWAFAATQGTEPRLMLYVRGQSAAGWSLEANVRPSGTGWYQQGVWNHYTVTWSAGNNFRVYRNGILIGGPYTIADPVTSWAGTQIWFGNNGTGQGMPGALIDDLRISNRTRTDTEIAAAFASGQPLTVDSNVTALYNFGNSLQSAVVLHTGTTAVTSVPVSVRNPGLNHVGLAPVNVVPVSPPVSPRFSYAGTTPVEAVPVAELRPGLSHTGLSGVQAVPVAAVAPHRFNYVGLTPAAVVPVAPITPASFNRVGLSPAIVAPVSKITVLPEIRNPTRVIIEDSRTEVLVG